MSLHREFLTANLFINIKKYIPWSSGFKNSEFLTHGAWRSRSLVVFDVGFELIILSHSIVYLFIYEREKKSDRNGPAKTIESFKGFHVR